MDEKNLADKASEEKGGVPCAGGATGAAKPGAASPAAPASKPKPASPFVRAENEDDDGYDPYSDRPARKEPLFERDPWA